MNIRKVDTFSGHRDSVYTIISDNTSHGFYSAGGDGFVIQWDLNKPDLGNLVARVGVSVYALGLEKENNALWIGQNYEGIQVLDIAQNKIERTSKITTAPIFDIQFFDNKALIALGDGVIVVMDIASFAVQKHIKVSGKNIRTIAINHETREFAVGDSDFNVNIFDLDGFVLKKTIQSHSNSVFSVKYSPDGKYLFTTGRDAHIKIWDVNDAYGMVLDIPAHLYAVNDISFSPDRTLFASCSMDKSVKVWDAVTFKLKKIIDRARHAGHGTSVNKLLWTSYENQLISCSDDRMISVWEVAE
ncbi:WD40 repeat domain-containing protein [Dyadobacter chenhuakuii]|uniref:WD40 repeat domain-containing protein n=1 Tax=Dyadobacter chenhuakuii TaxID=2909339 RepID=A0ABY4XJT9_9BACT|nr:cytochrome D1 domain-containing protein [Dyadobacter chenhuakuii]MCF2493577.1 WD40 repeat domain-containing protein [Dyadobacter chenhuakuii]USJ30715.1 WD40 repeat domain-containing protein [Dyadobacter chenhuakuii]